MSQKHKTPWQALEKVYKRKGLVLVLGAGVSVRSGLPSWDELLSRLASGTINGTVIFNGLRNCGYSQTAIASGLEQLYGSRAEFLSALKRSLYESFSFKAFPKPGSAKAEAFVKRIQVNNSTLRAVAAFCSSYLNGYRPNQKIASVLTFNLDSLLETFSELRYGKPIMRAVDHAAVSTSPMYISTYHVHGYIPFGKDQNYEESLLDVVFTERDYFDFFGNPLGLFTYTFLHMLRQHSCLFIGMSMRDDNVRRLLHYSASERRKAFSSVTGKKYGKDVTRRHYAILLRSTDSVDKVIESALVTLGVQTLWLDSYNQIPDHLAFVYEGGNESWDTAWEIPPNKSLNPTRYYLAAT